MEAQKKLTVLTKKSYTNIRKIYLILLGRIYFTDNDDYRNCLDLALIFSSIILDK